uniref:Putative secreted protein n=1 Tax=Ixodes ricinus TaxID=34613 RepID=A0A6B0UK56_IXORI
MVIHRQLFPHRCRWQSCRFLGVFSFSLVLPCSSEMCLRVLKRNRTPAARAALRPSPCPNHCPHRVLRSRWTLSSGVCSHLSLRAAASFPRQSAAWLRYLDRGDRTLPLRRHC